MGWAGHVERKGEGKDAYRGLVNKPNEKRALESLRRR